MCAILRRRTHTIRTLSLCVAFCIVLPWVHFVCLFFGVCSVLRLTHTRNHKIIMNLPAKTRTRTLRSPRSEKKRRKKWNKINSNVERCRTKYLLALPVRIVFSFVTVRSIHNITIRLYRSLFSFIVVVLDHTSGGCFILYIFRSLFASFLSRERFANLSNGDVIRFYRFSFLRLPELPKIESGKRCVSVCVCSSHRIRGVGRLTMSARGMEIISIK